jgi:hypothetical protein
MTEHDFEGILLELIDENPLAVRAVLQILAVEFTSEVATLAVSCSEDPVLMVNLAFVAEHCASEVEVKGLILHEFLHILLRHTRCFDALTSERHLAIDAVINAIIHRQAGAAYTGLMSSYYKDEVGIQRLLRPPSEDEEYAFHLHRCEGRLSQIDAAWEALYDGRLCADDIEALAKDLRAAGDPPDRKLLGGHTGGPDGARAWAVGHAAGPDSARASADSGPLPKALEKALDRSLSTMNGEGIWRSPHGRGVGADAYQREVLESNDSVNAWARATFEVLKRHVDPESNGSLAEARPIEYVLPVLSTGDRRAALRALWSPLFPNALWNGESDLPVGGTQVYLDVSGSMSAEMPLIVKLLGRLGRHIRRPFWAFSNVVAPAIIRNGLLIADTTGGTSMACVIEHIAQTSPPAAVIVTDGYIEALPAAFVRSAEPARLHAIVTRDGSPQLLHRAGISCTQLSRLP